MMIIDSIDIACTVRVLLVGHKLRRNNHRIIVTFLHDKSDHDHIGYPSKHTQAIHDDQLSTLEIVLTVSRTSNISQVYII